jgi:hypothetical protein
LVKQGFTGFLNKPFPTYQGSDCKYIEAPVAAESEAVLSAFSKLEASALVDVVATSSAPNTASSSSAVRDVLIISGGVVSGMAAFALLTLFTKRQQKQLLNTSTVDSSNSYVLHVL